MPRFFTFCDTQNHPIGLDKEGTLRVPPGILIQAGLGAA